MTIQRANSIYCKTLFFRRVLISRFPDVENLLHFNFVDFPVNFIKQFCFLFLLVPQTNVIIKIRPVLLFILHIRRILHIVSWKSWYSMQTKSWWWAIQKICMYLILRFYLNRENWMLAKYTCFTVLVAKAQSVIKTCAQSYPAYTLYCIKCL